MKFRILLFLSFISSFLAHAQVDRSNPNEYEEKKTALMRNEVSYGFTLHSAGFGFDFRRGKHITGYRKRMFEGELVSMKHPKEIRSVNPYFENAKSYVYGKLNQIIVLRGGIGEQKVLYSKAERTGIEIRMNYTGGLSLAFAKPIYLDVLNDATDYPYDYMEVKYDPEKHFIDEIIGRASYFKGFGEMNVFPGLYGKMGFSFDWGTNEAGVKSIEVGVVGDIYYKEIPMMAYNENHPYYFNFYLTMLFGKKW
jgi:hypothetical protein